MRNILLLFAVFSIFVILLSSYKIVLAVTSASAAQQQVIDFIQGKSELQNGFTISEVDHLMDVRTVMTSIDGFLSWCILLSVILGVLLYNDGILTSGLRLSGILSSAVLLLFLLIIYVGFSSLFTSFHSVFFDPGTWTFPSNSLLVQLFPVTFFLSITKKIVISALIVSATIGGIGYASS